MIAPTLGEVIGHVLPASGHPSPADLIHQEVVREIDQRQEAALSAVTTDLAYLTRQAALDLAFISKLPAVQDVLTALLYGECDAASRISLQDSCSRLETIFINYMASKTIYDQLRLLDLLGQEIVRVNLVEGRPERATPEQLQFKGDRYYFEAIMRLRPGEVYVSPIDLNQEWSWVERPPKGVIRFGVAMADQEGQPRGAIVINFLADQLFGG
jgi:hypothetical protein